MLIARIRTDSTDAVVDLAQRLCIAFNEPVIGIEVDGRYAGRSVRFQNDAHAARAIEKTSDLPGWCNLQ